ncbi:hypothetical protein Leryth_012788, partial [Lithospermum erythrorhizon]
MIAQLEPLQQDFFEEVPITSNPDHDPRVDGNGGNKLADQKEEEEEKADVDIHVKADVTERDLKSKKKVRWSEELVSESTSPTRQMTSAWVAPPTFNGERIQSNAYVPLESPLPINFSSEELRSKMETVKGVLGRWSKRVGEATKKAEDLAGNTWQHLKTGPSFADAALGRIAQGTKVLAEGGYEKIFHQTFETAPAEKLQDAFACYLSTSVGPVMGVLYVSTEKLAYCSDNPLSYNDSDATECSYYKVTI